MSAATCLLSEDELMCSICLEVFEDPVTTPCGHNFCKSCLTKHWDSDLLRTCPLCKEVFPLRPQLKTNTFISAMVSQFKLRAELGQGLDPEAEVPCDVCPEPKLPALKSCLVCLASYCHTHLEPHTQAAPLQTHQLVSPVQSLKDRTCSRHNKPLELFCETDQTLVCLMCSVLEHRNHELVPLKEAHETKQNQLKKVESEIQEMVLKRRQKIREVQQSLELSETAAEKVAAEGRQLFSDMIKVLQEGLDQVLQEIEEKQMKAKEQAADLTGRLEQQICDLDKRHTEVQQLSRSEDHLLVLQRFTSIKPAPTQDLTRVAVTAPSYFGTVHRAVSEAKKQIKTMEPKPLSKAQLKEVQRWAVDVTLDPDTAHLELGLSEDLKKVWYTGTRQNLPDNPERITGYHGVLAKQSISSGLFYFEVCVEGGVKWVVGVAKESMTRKEWVIASSLHGFWTIYHFDGNVYGTNNTKEVHFTGNTVLKNIGVFVYYEGGVVCFYNVDTADLLYCYSDCNFTEKLHPYFHTGTVQGKCTLTITPVKNAE